MNRPNILFICTDQQSRYGMGAYGNPHVMTPNLDAISGGGVRFRNSYCTSPVCGPSRCSIATGMMPHRLNAPYNDTPPTPGIRNLGEVFRNAGYRTAWAGKWHAPAAYPKTGGILGFEYTALPRDGNYFLGTCADPVVTEQAIQFLREPHDRPFLLGVSLHNPHDICHWIMHQHTDTLSRFEQAGRRPPLPRNTAPPKNEPEFIQMCRQREYYGQENTFTRDWDEDRWRQYLGVYFAMIEHADAQIGRIDSVLRKRGLYENTLVIFTSDHGEGMAEHRWVVKLMLYDSACSVPFVMRWPGGVSAGAVDSTHLVSGVDIFPTMCDYAGIEIPEGLDGESLRPIVEDPALPGREALVAELNPDPKRPEMEGRMLRTPRYKYMAFTHGKNPEALFDMENDPGETVNIAPDPGALDVLREHRSLLQKILAQTDDRFRMHLGKLRTGS